MSRRARSTRRRAAASAPAARGPRPAAPRRSPKCGRSAPATRWPATSPSALEPAPPRAGPAHGGRTWPWPRRARFPDLHDDWPLLRGRPGRRRRRRHDGGLERPRGRLDRVRPRAGQRRLGQHPSRRGVPGLGGRRRRLRRAGAQLPGHAALEHRQALPAGPGAGGRADGADGVGGAGHQPTPTSRRWPCRRARWWSSRRCPAAATARRATSPTSTRPPGRTSRELTAAGRTAMVQPYEPRVDTEGETALVFIGGRFTPRPAQGADDPPRRRARSTA